MWHTTWKDDFLPTRMIATAHSMPLETRLACPLCAILLHHHFSPLLSLIDVLIGQLRRGIVIRKRVRSHAAKSTKKSRRPAHRRREDGDRNENKITPIDSRPAQAQGHMLSVDVSDCQADCEMLRFDSSRPESPAAGSPPRHSKQKQRQMLFSRKRAVGPSTAPALALAVGGRWDGGCGCDQVRGVWWCCCRRGEVDGKERSGGVKVGGLEGICTGRLHLPASEWEGLGLRRLPLPPLFRAARRNVQRINAFFFPLLLSSSSRFLSSRIPNLRKRTAVALCGDDNGANHSAQGTRAPARD